MRLIFDPQLFFAASALAGSSAAVRTMDGSAILQKPNLDIKSKTTVTRGFLTKTQARSYLLSDVQYDRRPECPGCVHQSAGNYVRERGIINVPQSLIRRLIDIESGGDEQCSPKEYEPSFSLDDVPIYASRVNGTTDAHFDVDSKTKKPLTHHVGVVFLNTVEGAKFVVGDESFDIEEGTYISFPGGWVRHHIVMKRGSGWVKFLGPVQLDGNHGLVQDMDITQCMNGALSGLVGDTLTTGHGSFKKKSRQLEESEVTNSSGAVIGDIFVTGYTNGTGLNGDKNETLHLQWDLEGLYTDCGMKSCFHVEIKDDPTFCDNVAIGQLQSDVNGSESDGESDGGNHVILKNISHTEVTQGEGRVNVGKPIDHLLNFPVVVHGHDGAVLACDILTEITVPRNFSEGTWQPVDGTIAKGSSGASSISIGFAVFLVGAVALFVTI